MADFQFQIEDFLDFSEGDGMGLPTGAESAISREIGKQYSGDLETTASSQGFNKGLFSTLDIGSVLLGKVLVKDNATVLNKNQYLISGLLGGALTSEDNPGGTLSGGFDANIPGDIKAYAENARKKAGRQSTNSATGGAAGTGNGGPNTYNTAAYTFQANQLLNHPNFRYQGIGQGNIDIIHDDLTSGSINPWLIAELKILCDNFVLYINNFDVDREGHHTNSGHSSGSDHYAGNAVDIGDIAPLDDPENRDPIEGDSPLLQSVFACLNSINAPWRPTQIIAAALPSFVPGGAEFVNYNGISWGANADHGMGHSGNGHVHLACNIRPDPSEIPPEPTAKANNDAVNSATSGSNGNGRFN